MGLALLANLTAYDFGYIPAGQLVARTANALAHDGGAWSGTRATSTTGTTRRSLQPLPPLYVSAVDSGNLAGHLLTLRPGLLALADDRIVDRAVVRRPERHAADARRRASAASAPAPLARLQRDLETAYDSPARDARRGAAVARPARRAASPRSPRTSPRAAPPMPPAPPRRPATRRSGPTPSSASAATCGTSSRSSLRGARCRPRRRARRPRTRRGFRRCASWRRSTPSCAGHRAPRRRRVAGGQRWLDARRPSPSERRAAERIAAIERLARQCDELARMEYDFLYDRRAPPAGHRLQRRRAPARPELLRPARLGGAARQLRRDRAGPAAAGELVRARAPAHDRGRASRCSCRGAARCSST